MTPYILVVEDSEEDYETVRRLIKRNGFDVPLERAEDGEEALDLLTGDNEMPALIFLDLNLPGEDGRSILRTIKANSKINLIPVIVLTTSSSPRDIYQCYRSGANSYLVKPVDLPRFSAAIKATLNYWLKLVELPNSQTH